VSATPAPPEAVPDHGRPVQAQFGDDVGQVAEDGRQAGSTDRTLCRIRVRPDAAARRRCDDSGVLRSVLIVDDHEGFRRLARALLEADGFEVVGEAADGESAVTEVARLRPRLVLLDIQLPDIDGFEVAARLAAQADPPLVVLTSSRSASEYRRRLADSRAHGFIAKSDLSGEALAALVA
jgi:CheY-like chemotaxis protein